MNQPSSSDHHTRDGTSDHHIAHIGVAGGVRCSPVFPERILGPFAPALTRWEKIHPPFVNVVNYLHYRLRETAETPIVNELRVMYRIKSYIDGLHTTLGTFDDFTQISLLLFLETIKE